MSGVFDQTLANRALQQVMDRLHMLRLIDADDDAANVALRHLILEAMERGERDEENLILYAMGRFQAKQTGAQ